MGRSPAVGGERSRNRVKGVGSLVLAPLGHWMGRGLWKQLPGTCPGWEAAASPGQGQSFSEAPMVPIFCWSPEFVVIVAAATGSSSSRGVSSAVVATPFHLWRVIQAPRCAPVWSATGKPVTSCWYTASGLQGFHKYSLQKLLLQSLLHPMQEVHTVGLVLFKLTNKWIHLLPAEFSPLGLRIWICTYNVDI